MLVTITKTDSLLVLHSTAGCLGLNYRWIGYLSIFFGSGLGTLAGGLPFYYVKHQANSNQVALFFGVLFLFLTTCITIALYMLDPLGADTAYSFNKDTQTLRITEKRWYGTNYQDFSFAQIHSFDIIPREINPDLYDLYLYFDAKTRYRLDFGDFETQKQQLNLVQNFLKS